MLDQKDGIPKLGLFKLSSYIADLLLVGVGEEEGIKDHRTRTSWHLFFFSSIALVVWHVVRTILAPSFPEIQPSIRLVESFFYGYLIITLLSLIYRHYHFMLLPRRDLRFVNIVFFFVVIVLLFSRLYYSLLHFDPNLFKVSDTTITPTSDFGIHGYKDVASVVEFIVFSGCAMVNCSYSGIQPASPWVSFIALIQSFIGYIFVAILIATFVEISSELKPNKE